MAQNQRLGGPILPSLLPIAPEPLEPEKQVTGLAIHNPGPLPSPQVSPKARTLPSHQT